MSSRDRRERKLRQIGVWVKWAAVLLSLTLLATTLLLVHRLRSVGNGSGAPASVQIGDPVTAR